jgi:uncharacterized membrane protein YphA (DoxX/SURF4 family)
MKGAIIIRFLLFSIYLSEGIQKFANSDVRGVGRFEKLGVFFPDFTAPLVGATEIIIALFFLIGLYSRVAAVISIVIMLFAIYYTQIPVLLNNGFFAFATKIRTDWSMLLCSSFILIFGAGAYTLDSLFKKS